MTLLPEIEEVVDRLAAWRRELHRYPEIGMDVPETARRVAEWLRACGVDQVIEGVAGAGVVGIVDQGDGPGIGLRSDMDALPIEEANAFPHTSCHAGRMHACGHDGHMATLLGAAWGLARRRRFRGRAVLIFQPGEETLEGARALVDDGTLDRFGVDAIYGLHNLPGDAAGTMRIPDGPVMASSNRFSVTLRGQGGHAALPELCRNPIEAAAELVPVLHGWEKEVLGGDRVVVAVTSVTAGTGAYNVIPEEARLAGSLRHLGSEGIDTIAAELRRRCDAIAGRYRVQATLALESLCPATMNSSSHAAFAREVGRRVCGASAVVEGEPLMASEDFSLLLHERPGAFALIGNGPSAPLHHAAYDFNDEVLPTGASYLIGLVEEGGGVP
jgi:hippurate hydrolase